MYWQSVLPLDADDDSENEQSQSNLSEITDTQSSTPPELKPHYGPTADCKDFALHLLALGRVRGVGVKTLRALINQYGDLSRVWDDDPEHLQSVLDVAKVPRSTSISASIFEETDRFLAAAERDLRFFHSVGIRIIGAHEPDFPDRLKSLPSSPYWLFIEGNVRALQSPLIGIVGTRTPTSIGIQAAERLTAVVCREGLGIVSGLAEGIDASAHRVGLYYRAPQVAVLGTGIDIVFPASTEGIRRRLIETDGAIITEYLPGDSYNRGNFVERNRIQATLARALAPVESRKQSGTAHTVRFAEQYHCPIFGVRRGSLAPENELFTVLEAKGYPIFDLAETEEVSRLVAWLKSVLSTDVWPQQRRRPDTRWFFRDILRQIDEILVDTPLSSTDAHWFQEQINKRVRPLVPPDEEGRNGYGH